MRVEAIALWWRILLPLAWAGGALTAAAQGAPAEPRVALVIGNAAYPAAALRNPVNDANVIAEKLRKLGFAVTLKTDVKQREMTRAVSQFGQSLKPGSVALFYYAGHGMQVKGRNFLIPVDAEIETEASVRSEAVDLDLLLEQLGPARLSMVILDACRNNPFENRFRSGVGGGLAQIDAPKGTLLAYATAPGKVASDGLGSHGLYTSELLRAIDAPGAKVEEVFKAVRVNVIKATGGEQVPWESSSLTGDFYFRPAAPAPEASKLAREVQSKEAQSKEAQLQARLDAERRQREQDAKMLMAEMEKLREEVRRLTESTAARDANPAAAAEPPKAPVVAESTKPPAVAEPLKSPAVAKEKKPPAKDAQAPDMEAAAKMGASPRSEHAMREWARRIGILEAQRGSLTLTKAIAVLLGPFTDEQLLQMVKKERALRELPYSSAFAIGITADGAITSWRNWNERTMPLAEEVATQRCGRKSATRCSVVMVNGEFREAAFLEWAGNARGRNILKLRSGFLALRAD
jgi:uncharacterized caspase-like protein